MFAVNSRKACKSGLLFLIFGILCLHTNADIFNPGQFWKTVKNEMLEFEKMAENVSDMISSESKVLQKALEDEEEEDGTTTATVFPSEDNIQLNITTAGPTLIPVAPTDDVKTSNEEIDTDVDLNPFSGDMFSEIFGHQFPSMFSILRANKPWWHGPNVCVDRQEKNETKDEAELGSGPQHIIMFGASQFTSCKQTPSKYICTTVVSQPRMTKTVTVTYQCCHGYRKLKKNNNMCSKVEMKQAIDVLNDMEAKEFVSLVKSSGLEEKIDSQNMTMFIPSDTAMKHFEEKMQESNQIDFQSRRRRQSENDISLPDTFPAKQPVHTKDYSRDLVLSHMTPGLIELADFTNEKVLLTEQNSTMRLNVYYGKQSPVVTVNCAPITVADNYATNSVIHMVDHVLPIVNKNLLQLLDQPQFSEFKKLLENNDLLEMLSKEGPLTVFAPTNDAIKKLDAGLRAKYNRGEACIKTVLKHHILPHSLCTAAVNATRISTVNVGGDWIHIHTDDDGRLVLDDKARVILPDMVATNGILHATDKILSPKTAKPVTELLSSTNHTSWLSLMERAGIMDELNNANNLTLFVPAESVFADNATRNKLDTLDDAALRDVMLYHAAQHGCGISDDTEIESFIPSQKLRINSYSAIPVFSGVASRMTVECARIMRKEGKACNSAVYEIDRLLLPPNGTILQVIESDPELSQLNGILKGTKLEEELKGLSENSYTFLAPTNDAIQKLSEETQKKLSEDKELADVVLRRHVIPEVVCCSGVGVTPWPFTKSVDTLSGKAVEINRDHANRVRFAGNKVVQCDKLATDGLVHHVSNVFMPRSSPVIKSGTIVFGNPGMEVHLYGV
ncbi:midline fasciclin [Lycorma delicatula]|uniref:midline fasciclin n=1 Tax=Lycorma delicatula TaxID=130591 RepID=UPI003F5124E8